MPSEIVTNRNQIVNKVSAHLGARQDSKVIRDLVEFYRTPLVKALRILNKQYKVSLQRLADEVFDGEVSRQAVFKNYIGGTK